MKLSEELVWRGFLQDTTYPDLSVLDGDPITFYHGFDASAPSQTVGNLAAMMLDKLMVRHGHKAILLAGGATSLIGDPGGKDKERPMQSADDIAKNVEAAKKQLEVVFADQEFTLVNNLDWTKDMKVLDFLRDIGKHYSMTPLVQRDYIAQRMGEGGAGISYTEFSYTLLQGMDYQYLYDTYGVTLQLGGSDQWGNCLSGVELIRKSRGAETHVITNKLVINKATGKKFGKSEDGAVWLDPQLTSPYKFYQFWLNSDDDGVEDYLKIYTEIGKQELEQLMEAHREQPHLRQAQKRLAQDVTKLIHGQDALDNAQTETAIVFGDKEVRLTEGVIKTLVEDQPSIKPANNEHVMSDTPAILVALGLASSKSEARNFLASGAIKAGVEAEKINETTDLSMYESERIILLRRGKNSIGIIDLR